jgi:hypothetical protein
MLDMEDELLRKAVDSDDNTSWFDHKTAPPRGSTDKDKTYRDVYVRYDSRIDDDYAVDEKWPRG